MGVREKKPGEKSVCSTLRVCATWDLLWGRPGIGKSVSNKFLYCETHQKFYYKSFFLSEQLSSWEEYPKYFFIKNFI